MAWKVFFATATGRTHQQDGVPCQDSGGFLLRGGVLVASVCDGAGSARAGGEGAARFAALLPERVAAQFPLGPPALEDEAREALARALAEVRAGVATEAAARDLVLADFACTLVGCIASVEGGWIFHVGDGYGASRGRDGEPGAISRPENGEFADETYFLTDDAWDAHLRLTPIPAPGQGGVIGLLSDGVAPFAIDRARSGFFAPFLDPVLAYLAGVDEAAGSEALAHLLAGERALEISADDKALLLAIAT